MQLHSWRFDVKTASFRLFSAMGGYAGTAHRSHDVSALSACVCIYVCVCMSVCLWKKAKLVGKTAFSVSLYWKSGSVEKALLLVALTKCGYKTLS